MEKKEIHKKRKIISDIDETLIDFVNPFIKFHNAEYNTNFFREQVNFYALAKTFGFSREELTNEFNAFYDSSEFLNLKPLPNAVEGIRIMHELDFSLLLCTSRPDQLKFPTLTTISTYFNGAITGIHFCDRLKKIEYYLSKEPEFVIEDDLEVLLLAAEEGIPSFLIDQKGNQKENLPSLIFRAGNYSEPGSQWSYIIKFLKEFGK